MAEKMDCSPAPGTEPSKPEKIQVPPISTDEIGEVLDSEYGNQGNEPIDYFFLQIRKRHVKYLPSENTTRVLHKAILDLNQSKGMVWKKVSPGTKWPAQFFGKFPKQHSEMERARELRLNKEVREILKSRIEKELKEMYREYCKKEDVQVDEENLPRVSIMITRACKYTLPDGSFYDEEL